MKLNEKFFSRPADKVAKELLGKILCRKINQKILKAKIVETEAYFGEEDPASWARFGKRKDNSAMWEKGGTILIKNVHKYKMFNLVTGNKNSPQAVLIRALEPLNFEGRCFGPGLLTDCLKINKSFNGESVFGNKDIWIEAKTGNFCINSSTGNCQIKENNGKYVIVKSFRIGIKKDLPEKLRFYIKDNLHVSRK